jgi:hypothetical protein
MQPLETMAPLIGYAVLGLLELFAGYRLFRILVVALGALAGFMYGPDLLTAVLGEVPDQTQSLLAALGGALLFGLLARLAVIAAAVVWVGAMAYSFASLYLSDWFLLLLVVLAAGLLVVFLERLIVIVVTSLHGAWLAVAAIAALLGSDLGLAPLPRNADALLLIDTPFLLGAALLLALAGMLVQSSSPPRRRGSPRR